jgi:lycopene cyclase domain-containing protein
MVILAMCVAITLPLETLLGARVYRRPLRLLATLVPVVAVFGLWDLLASRHGNWWWSPGLLTGVRPLGLPLEEWLFLVVIPVCVLLTYEVLGRWPVRASAPAAVPADPRSALERGDA